jgi:hypothetical protein
MNSPDPEANPLARFPWPLFAAIVTAAVGGGLLGGALDALLAVGERPLFWAVVGLAVLLTGLCLGYHYQFQWTGLRGLRTLPPQPRPALILFVSTLNGQIAWQGGVAGTFPLTVTMPARPAAGGPAEARCQLEGRALAGDLARLDKEFYDRELYWNWQQLLRALEPHAGGALECLHLVLSATVQKPLPGGGSREVAGSDRHREDVLALLGSYRLSTSTPKASVVDFENLDAVVAELRRVIQEFGAAYGARDVVVDVTGGLKTTSIAGALLTLNNEALFQYVQSRPDAIHPAQPDPGPARRRPRVLCFDVRAEPPPAVPGA